jgi:hypothetical protein
MLFYSKTTIFENNMLKMTQVLTNKSYPLNVYMKAYRLFL